MLQSDHRSFLLTLTVQKGRQFPLLDESSTDCILFVATFNGEAQQSHLSYNSPSGPVWDCRLQWRVGASQLKQLESTGQGHCKIAFAAQDGRQLGWVVCDLRTARLHGKHPQKPSWWTLAGPYRGRESPEVLLYHSLDDEPCKSLDQPTSTTESRVPRQQPRLTGSPSLPASTSLETTSAHTSQLELGASHPSECHTSNMNSHLLQTTTTLGQQLVSDGSQRCFELSLDLQEFQAGRRLPLNLATIVVQVSLPQDLSGVILQSNGRLPPRLSPLRTQPPVDVARGSEAALPGGQASVQFTAGLMTLATLLARNPVMTVEVWHKERLAEDTLLGRAHIPLSPLLQESWVDGRAGVFAALPAADGSGYQERIQVQVGSLHLVMALEEVGPAKEVPHGVTPQQLSPQRLPLQPLPRANAALAAAPAPQSQPKPGHPPASPVHTPSASAAPLGALLLQQQSQQHQQQAVSSLGTPLGAAHVSAVLQQVQPAMAVEGCREVAEGPAAGASLQALQPSLQAALREASQPSADPSAPGSAQTSPPAGNAAQAPGAPAAEAAAPAGAGASPADPTAPAGGPPGPTASSAQVGAPLVVSSAAPGGAAAVYDPSDTLQAVQRQQQQLEWLDHATASAGSGGGRDMQQLSQQPHPVQGPAKVLMQDRVASHAPVVCLGGGLAGAGPAAAGAMEESDAPAQAQRAEQPLAPEVEAAWEVELWKREEQEKWKAEMRRKGEERMATLEAEWRRREQERDAEQATLRQQCAAMQAKAEKVLEAVEDREKKVLAAEELVACRRRELEREHTARVSEAEGAVRRLQMEFEHQMEMERLRTRDLEQQAATCRERVSTAEARAAAAERALQEFKEQQSRSPAELLEQQLGQTRAAHAEAERRAQRAAEAKQKYKEQVIQLAHQVSALQRQVAELVGLRREQLDAEVARLAAQEAALSSRKQAGELGELRQQLKALQAGGGAKERLPPQGLVLGPGARTEEVQRLLRERDELLGSGAYAKEDAVIQQLDCRIRECAALAAGGGAA